MILFCPENILKGLVSLAKPIDIFKRTKLRREYGRLMIGGFDGVEINAAYLRLLNQDGQINDRAVRIIERFFGSDIKVLHGPLEERVNSAPTFNLCDYLTLKEEKDSEQIANSTKAQTMFKSMLELGRYFKVNAVNLHLGYNPFGISQEQFDLAVSRVYKGIFEDKTKKDSPRVVFEMLYPSDAMPNCLGSVLDDSNLSLFRFITALKNKYVAVNAEIRADEFSNVLFENNDNAQFDRQVGVCGDTSHFVVLRERLKERKLFDKELLGKELERIGPHMYHVHLASNDYPRNKNEEQKSPIAFFDDDRHIPPSKYTEDIGIQRKMIGYTHSNSYKISQRATVTIEVHNKLINPSYGISSRRKKDSPVEEMIREAGHVRTYLIPR